MRKLTVIMPVFNGEKYLSEAINSVLQQTFSDFYFLIFNDNSTDNTLNILNDFALKDSRIKVFSTKENFGPGKLRNQGIDLATTPYIAFLDADDIALPNRFEKQITFLENNSEYGLCGSWFTVFGDKKEKVIKHAVEHEYLKVQFLHSCGLGNSTVMFKKMALNNLRFENEFFVAEDYALWSELIAQTKIYNIPESLVKYRWHATNISKSKADEMEKAELSIKKRQLKRLNINYEDSNYYVNAVSLKRKQSIEEIKKTISASYKLLEKNKIIKFYNQEIFQKHIEKTILRTIRNAKKNNFSYFKYLKNESVYFSKIKMLDKIILFFKCLF